MPEAELRGVTIVYRTFGEAGPWVALSPGSRRSHDELVPIAEGLAAGGFRVLLHDRRNCGASSVGMEYLGSENEMWADDLAALCRQLGAFPVYVGGSSSGARLALIFALRHPELAAGLLLWRITGGEGVLELADLYYGAFIELAHAGGMEAICASDHFAACISRRPSNRDRLMRQSPAEFIEVMSRWRDDFVRSASMPVIGVTPDQLRGLPGPTLLVPGVDRIHATETAEALSRLMPNSVLKHLLAPLPKERRPDDWQAQWAGKEPELVDMFSGFLSAAAT